ncbi:gamma-glutamyltranspeptidase [Gemmatirosa kalamazoonensis]|uniref:Gamma-glutamyltranspeptidase n=1 Tax=Gemmatirosa kalamazoonensis TaxID=861299 RepID=W0RD09_9BACT|nr:gamma-glutamyltransferase [Gemmatirosa kalamazoonensis]AHG88327.1 gamma-glutamyltranspeptidase [Gemmatirosa kalamazoonensis]
MHSLAVLAALALQPTLPGTARTPAYAPDGRLAIAVDGDLWVSAAPVTTAPNAVRWIRVTSGAAWDREPAWTRDGAALVFASDRAGGFDLWRVRVGADGAAGAPERLTTAPEPEGEPSVAPDGRVAFVRGQGAAARLWIRLPNGEERRLGRGDAPERWPAFSPDGARLVSIAPDERGARIRVRRLAGGDSVLSDSTVLTGQPAERPAWAPAGDRLAFAGVSGGTRGVFVTPLDGRYVNLVSARRAAPAWSPDGRTIALAPLGDDAPGYNGDPDRLRDPARDVGERLRDARDTAGLWTIDAPAAVDASLAPRAIALDRPRAERNAEAFDRAWTRTAALYFAGDSARDRRRAWEAVRDRLRPAALAAASDSTLEDVIHRAMLERPPLRASATGRAAVSSAHPVATAAGLEILRRGGNVVDAAVAVSFALGVVEPDASGVGGYGEMLVRQRGMARPALVEFMGRVPEEATLDDGALLVNGRYPDDGPVLPVVPGTVAGMHTAWKRFGSGKIPWAELLAPAIRAARGGYAVSEGLATTLATERAHFMKYAGSRALFFREGRPLGVGDTVRNPDLAWVLEQIAARGADGFYRGEVARRLVQDLRGQGNAMRLTDLARYYAAEREPVGGTYRGLTVWSSAPPVSGGASLVSQLQILEQLAPTPRPYPDDAATLHAMLAAWQLVPSTRGRIADPGLWPVDVTPFTSRDTARARARCFDPSRAVTLPCEPAKTTIEPQRTQRTQRRTNSMVSSASSASSAVDAVAESPCGPEHAREVTACHSAGTTAFTVADAEGNVVAVTQTLGTWGGNFYVSPGLGFLYNDKLTSYGTDPAEYGARLPNARHGSTLAPTIVLDGAGPDARPVLAVGAAGNAWIGSAVYQTLVGAVDGKLDAQRALELPRFLPSGRGPDGPAVQLEDGFAPAAMRRLQALGYRLQFVSLPGELREGYGAAITFGRGTVTAGADPRRAGAAGAVR